ncbi:hypothetical protein C0J52_16092 [Blattella germanica]|nr:hypothetical protein C0J52_16092 [Blattella germanica]
MSCFSPAFLVSYVLLSMHTTMNHCCQSVTGETILKQHSTINTNLSLPSYNYKHCIKPIISIKTYFILCHLLLIIEPSY